MDYNVHALDVNRHAIAAELKWPPVGCRAQSQAIPDANVNSLELACLVKEKKKTKKERKLPLKTSVMKPNHQLNKRIYYEESAACSTSHSM